MAAVQNGRHVGKQLLLLLVAAVEDGRPQDEQLLNLLLWLLCGAACTMWDSWSSSRWPPQRTADTVPDQLLLLLVAASEGGRHDGRQLLLLLASAVEDGRHDGEQLPLSLGGRCG